MNPHNPSTPDERTPKTRAQQPPTTSRSVLLSVLTGITALVVTLLPGATTAAPMPTTAKQAAVKTQTMSKARTVSATRYIARPGRQVVLRPIRWPANKRHAIRTIGVASVNMYVKVPQARAKADAHKLISRRDVDIVGWNEATWFHGVLRGLAKDGWATRIPRDPEARELAVSWRKSKFRFDSHQLFRMHDGAGRNRTSAPFPARYVYKVVLRDRTTGKKVAIINTHSNQTVEHKGRPNNNINARRAKAHFAKLRNIIGNTHNRWVFVTGDFNVDYRWDYRVRSGGFPAQTVGRVAQPNWRVLGTFNQVSHPHTGRNIDYVWRKHFTPSRFVLHRLLRGYASDHKPVLARAYIY